MASTASAPSATAFDAELLDARPGYAILRITGPTAAQHWTHEAGGHRWQRIPPTEKRGRVQTSTITIAVLEEPQPVQLVIKDSDLDIVATTGSGPGGQHRNKTASAIQLTHRPTGTRVRIETERSQHANKALALALLRARLWEAQHSRISSARQADRRSQIGSGMRGDKRRTIRQDGVVDHPTGQRWRYPDYVRGRW